MITSRLEIIWSDGDEWVLEIPNAEQRVERLAKVLKRSQDEEIKSIRLHVHKPISREVSL